MCDKYGFMVIDEADIEAHGPFMIYRKEDTDYNRFKRWNEKIADDPVWEEAIVDRVKLMVERDKNRFCIVMWSMGNESAYGCNFEKALEWTKNFDPDRITQYAKLSSVSTISAAFFATSVPAFPMAIPTSAAFRDGAGITV